MPSIRKVKVGDVISEGLMNDIIDLANRAQLSVSQGSGLVLSSGPNGYELHADIPHSIWGRIDGPAVSGLYPFTLQWPASGGGWTDGNQTGKAYESNANPSVPVGSYVELDWLSSGDYRFTLGSC